MSISPELAAAEFAAGMTALSVTMTAPNGTGPTIAAVSADARWGYEKDGRTWVAFLRRPTLDDMPVFFYAGSLDDARRDTFDHDHPIHSPEREPRPARYTFR